MDKKPTTVVKDGGDIEKDNTPTTVWDGGDIDDE